MVTVHFVERGKAFGAVDAGGCHAKAAIYVLGEAGCHAVAIILEIGALGGVFGSGVGVAADGGDAAEAVVGVGDLLAFGVGFVGEGAVGVVDVRCGAVFRVGYGGEALVGVVGEGEGLGEGSKGVMTNHNYF